MKYDLTTACQNCPFRRSTKFSFDEKRAHDIVYNDGGFSCHKTTTQKGRDNEHKDAQACAGRLIMLEHAEQPDQMMRICERIGLYDRTKLNMEDTDVFDDIEEFLDERIEC